MFVIEKEGFGDYIKVKLVNKETEEYFSFLLNHGCKLNELVLAKNEKKYSVLKGDESAEAVTENRGAQGNLLCPFPNRVNKGKYSFEGKEYQLEINPKHGHAIHGLIFDKAFTIMDKEENDEYAYVKTQYKHEGSEGYPFHFLVEVIFQLDRSGFSCETIVTNTNEGKIPIGIGWHPYFTLGGKIDEDLLQLGVDEELLVDKKMIPTGKKVPVIQFKKEEQIGNVKLDTGYKVSHDHVARLSNNEVSLEIWQEKGKGKYNYVQIYIPKDRESIAIEPMTCPANAFNSGEGLIILDKRKTCSASYSVRLR